MIPRLPRAFLYLVLWMFLSGAERGSDASSPSPPLSVGNIQIRLQADEIVEEDDAPRENGATAYHTILQEFQQEVQQINHRYRSELKQIFSEITEEIQKARQRSQARRQAEIEQRASTEAPEDRIDAKTLVGDDGEKRTDGDVSMESPVATDHQKDVETFSEDALTLETSDVAVIESVRNDEVELESFIEAEQNDEVLRMEVDAAVENDGESMLDSVAETTDPMTTVKASEIDNVLDSATDGEDIMTVDENDDSSETAERVLASSEVPPAVKTPRKRKKKSARRLSTGVRPALVTPKTQASAFVTTKRKDVVSETIEDEDDDALEIIKNDDEENDDDASDAELLRDDGPLSMNKVVSRAIQQFIQTVVTALVIGILYTVIQRLIAIVFRILFVKSDATTGAVGKSNLPATKGKGILQPQP